MRAASEQKNLRVPVCQANFFDSLVDRIRQRRKEPLNQQHRVVQKHMAILWPRKPAKKNIKHIKPTERFTSNGNKIVKSTNDYRDERHPSFSGLNSMKSRSLQLGFCQKKSN